jgi:hypothetical protein
MFASSKMMKGQFPPSSRVVFFRPSAQSFATSLPTLVYKDSKPRGPRIYWEHRLHTEPVKVTFLTRGCLHNASLSGGVFSRLVVRTLNTPFGNPACSANRAKLKTDSGVSGDGLTTIVQPAARAAPATLCEHLTRKRFRILQGKGLPTHLFSAPWQQGNSTVPKLLPRQLAV